MKRYYLYAHQTYDRMKDTPDELTRQNALWSISTGDEEAFQLLFKTYYANLCVYANRFVEDMDTCEDLVQDVFCSIWLNRKKLNYTLSVRNYLVTSVKHHCLNYLRNSSKQEFDYHTEIEKLPVYADDNEDIFLIEEMRELLNKTLASLPDEYRIAFEMSRMEEKPIVEIAEVLGVSVRTVERYRNKAVEIIKSELKDYIPLLCLFLSIRL